MLQEIQRFGEAVLLDELQARDGLRSKVRYASVSGSHLR